MTKKSSHQQHPLRNSCLFRIGSRSKLARVLGVEPSFLEAQTKFKAPYNEFELNGRWIEEPKPGLKKIQARFAYLLGRIQTPDYLHSAIKTRSYISNASGHSASMPAGKLDVKKFYPSARSAQVYHFLHDVLEWPRDIAGLGTALFTWKGHLPTGGNASPILSFWAYKPMFDEIAQLAKERSCLFSLYVDDMTLTGELAGREMLYRARQIVGRHRLRAHKFHHFGAGQARVITGVANTKSGTRLPLRRQKAIAEGTAKLRACDTDEGKFAHYKPLIGRLFEAAHVDPLTWSPLAQELLSEMRKLNLKLQSNAA